MPHKYIEISHRIADYSCEFLMNTIRHNTDYSNVQYCNFHHVKEMFDVAEILLNRIDKNKSHINIGTGCGFLEYCNKENHKIKLKTADLGSGAIDPMFPFAQNLLNVKQDYQLKFMRKDHGSDLKIVGTDPFNDFTRWDNAIFSRFVPMRKTLVNLENISKFNENMKKYVDRITIVSVLGTYPDISLFPNAKITDFKLDGYNWLLIEYDI